MIRTHADYGELLQKLSPPNRIIVAIGPDWDSEHPEEREMEVTIEGRGPSSRTPRDWESRWTIGATV